MKKMLALMAAAAAIVLPEIAKAQNSGCYVGGFGGANFVNVDKSHVNGTDDVDVDLDTGYVIGANGGYKFCNGIRFEGEIAFRKNMLDSARISGNKLDLSGHVQTWSFMANAIYDLPGCFNITPYVGGGIGYAYSKGKVTVDDSISVDFDGHSDKFAWQIIAGASYPIFDNIELGLEYRYFNVDARAADHSHSAILSTRTYF